MTLPDLKDYARWRFREWREAVRDRGTSLNERISAYSLFCDAAIELLKARRSQRENARG